jgi:hypothetical protein
MYGAELFLMASLLLLLLLLLLKLPLPRNRKKNIATIIPMRAIATIPPLAMVNAPFPFIIYL